MSRPRVQSLIKLTYWTFSVGSVQRGLSTGEMIKHYSGTGSDGNLVITTKSVCQRFTVLDGVPVCEGGKVNYTL